jgi:ribosomal protein S18 acetylase RimI-like enzyme
LVKLIPMQEADFTAYVENSVREYAQDHVKNGDWLPEEAERLSRKEFQQLLPDGLGSKNQFVFSIVDEEGSEKLGSLWVQVKLDTPRRQAFIYDFVLKPEFRGKGYGKQALLALDEQLRSMNVESVALHVFAQNKNAFELYKKMGYETTDLHMRKVYKKD